MGAWGVGIEENDTVLDVLGTFVEHLKAAQSLEAATAAVREAFAWSLSGEDADEGVQARLGLALAQWRYGALEPALLDAVRDDLAARRGIDTYSDPKAREQAVRKFVAKIGTPNAKPKAWPKPPKAPKRPRKPKPAAFAAGDCLALQLPGGGWRAALVLVDDVDCDGDGFNVVARLDWEGATAPTTDVFETPNVSFVAMYPSRPYRAAAGAAVVGRRLVEPRGFGIEKWPGDWQWRFIAPRGQLSPMAWFQWDALAGRLPGLTF